MLLFGYDIFTFMSLCLAMLRKLRIPLALFYILHFYNMQRRYFFYL